MKLVKGQTPAKKLAERRSPAEDRRSFIAIFEESQPQEGQCARERAARGKRRPE